MWYSFSLKIYRKSADLKYCQTSLMGIDFIYWPCQSMTVIIIVCCTDRCVLRWWIKPCTVPALTRLEEPGSRTLENHCKPTRDIRDASLKYMFTRASVSPSCSLRGVCERERALLVTLHYDWSTTYSLYINVVCYASLARAHRQCSFCSLNINASFRCCPQRFRNRWNLYLYYLHTLKLHFITTITGLCSAVAMLS